MSLPKFLRLSKPRSRTEGILVHGDYGGPNSTWLDSMHILITICFVEPNMTNLPKPLHQFKPVKISRVLKQYQNRNLFRKLSRISIKVTTRRNVCLNEIPGNIYNFPVQYSLFVENKIFHFLCSVGTKIYLYGALRLCVF